ncbi:MAG TPA: DUF1223 domain-containing protein [Thermoanaerobaculia bacterium]|nr:DUF1223 domain-containing protein [Thermoanaerobaculia bacterium]
MGRLLLLSIVASTLLTLGWLRLEGSPQAAATQGGPYGPVVVELFTSQGCSSCPPADRLLSRLPDDPRLAGKVIPLAFHVDYWNQIGWTDPFSARRWSERQEGYARAFRSSQVYTPQVVIGGRSECVGSREDQVRRGIADALAAEPAARVSLALAPPSPDGKLRATVAARLARAAAGAGPGGLELWVALTESGLTTAVGAGENASRTLRNDHVVRRLEKAFTLPAAAGAERSAELALELPSGAARDPKRLANLSVAAFLQDPASLAIHGAAVARVAPGGAR